MKPQEIHSKAHVWSNSKALSGFNLVLHEIADIYYKSYMKTLVSYLGEAVRRVKTNDIKGHEKQAKSTTEIEKALT